MVEKYNASYNGKNITFNRIWGGHRFTDDECIRLISGETISFEYTNKKGQTQRVSGKLDTQTYQGKTFLGFKPNFKNKPAHIPTSWCQHQFTSQEMETLLNGGKIFVDDCVSTKNNKPFSCSLTIENGALKPIFNNSNQSNKNNYGSYGTGKSVDMLNKITKTIADNNKLVFDETRNGYKVQSKRQSTKDLCTDDSHMLAWQKIETYDNLDEEDGPYVLLTFSNNIIVIMYLDDFTDEIKTSLSENKISLETIITDYAILVE